MARAKRPLTPQDIAALQAGATAESLGLTPEDVNTGETPEQPQATSAETAPESTEPTPTQAATQPAATSAADTSVVAYLQGQVTLLTREKVTAEAQLAATQAQMASMQATHDALLAIARGSLSTMKTALSATGFSAEAMTAEQVLAEHAATSEAFKTKFRAGGVAQPTKPTETARTAAPSARTAALFAAVPSSK